MKRVEVDELRKVQLPQQPVATSETVLEEFVERELTAHHGRKYQRGVSHGPLPIIMGITGHRDLREEDIPKLEEVLRAEYQRLQKRYPSTSFIMLSALAEGADRLCARLALELGLRLIAVLPMPRDLYEEDFDQESKKDFRDLLARAEHQFELPILEGFTREDLAQHSPERNLHYANLGAYIASHCAILVALWDGVHLTKIGGTSQIVRYKLEGIPEPFAPPHSALDAPDSGPVYHIVTPRESNPTTNGTPFSLVRMYPDGYDSYEAADHAYHDIYLRMEMFNSDALKYAEELKEHRRSSMEYVIPSKLRKLLHPSLREVLDFYSIADVLSQRFQKRTFAILRLLLTFVFFAAFFFEIYTELFDETALIVLYLLMFACSFATYFWAARKGYQTKYLDYRALAEGLRVQFFWKLADLKDSAADYYMRKQKSELDWIRNAVRSCMTETCPEDEEMEHAPHRERIALVLKHWVQDQAKYFKRSAHRDHKMLHRNERKVEFLFASALALAVAQLFIHHNHLILLGIAILPVVGAVIHTYLHKNAIAEHTKQYERMSVYFHRAQVHLEKLLTEDRIMEAQHFIGELGKEALTENGDWILTHRERPLEVPKGA